MLLACLLWSRQITSNSRSTWKLCHSSLPPHYPWSTITHNFCIGYLSANAIGTGIWYNYACIWCAKMMWNYSAQNHATFVHIAAGASRGVFIAANRAYMKNAVAFNIPTRLRISRSKQAWCPRCLSSPGRAGKNWTGCDPHGLAQAATRGHCDHGSAKRCQYQMGRCQNEIPRNPQYSLCFLEIFRQCVCRWCTNVPAAYVYWEKAIVFFPHWHMKRKTGFASVVLPCLLGQGDITTESSR